MYRSKHEHIKQLSALLLMAVMVLTLATKALHKHSLHSNHTCHQENSFAKADVLHGTCNICEFQLAGDASFSGEILLVIAPVHIASTYGRLLTSINPDRLFATEGRGPPCV